MIFSVLVAIATCCTAWFLTSPARHRQIGCLFDAVLWLLAGVTAGKLFVVLVAAVCAICFSRPILRALMYSRFRRQHA